MYITTYISTIEVTYNIVVLFDCLCVCVCVWCRDVGEGVGRKGTGRMFLRRSEEFLE